MACGGKPPPTHPSMYAHVGKALNDSSKLPFCISWSRAFTNTYITPPNHYSSILPMPGPNTQYFCAVIIELPEIFYIKYWSQTNDFKCHIYLYVLLKGYNDFKFGILTFYLFFKLFINFLIILYCFF